MAEGEPEGEQLSALLESALAEFGGARDTDEELDSMMARMDQQAARSAAKRFEQAMKGTGQQEVVMSEEERKAAENFQNMLKALIEAEQKALDSEEQDNDRAGAQQAFIRQLKKLSEEDPANIAAEDETLMSLVHTFFSKDLMYPPLKQLLQRFPQYISMNSEKLDLDTVGRYEKQIDVLQRVCAEYEKDESDDVEEMRARFDSISTLMMELQSYGYPPEELVGEAPPGWVTDPDTGLPRVEDVSKAAESCSLM